MIRKFLLAFKYAWQGLVYAAVTQRNFRLHIAATLVVCVAGWYSRISAWQWAAVIMCCTMVLAMEAVNSSLEELCNYLFKQQHPAAKAIKDMGAAAVLITALGALVVGAVIFGPYVWRWLGNL